ncbi:MAG: 4-alpha-glucanotransferase [Candidatus Krumholzibacteriota bacterium]|nr:4-alpha-glucanotransferase [Candidatus Krumholzibacteriota bacterium]
MKRRASGILLHVSSLPSRFGVGDLGPDAYRWIDFLVRARQSCWQVLPMGPVSPAGHNCPYQATSSVAGNPVFISPSLLRDEGLLTEDDLKTFPVLPEEKVDYAEAAIHKRRLLETAYVRYIARGDRTEFNAFRREHADWLDDFALFTVLREKYPGPAWSEWPAAVRDRNPDELGKLARECLDAVEREKFFQFVFFQQWWKLKRYANRHGVQIIGDVPYYVGYDCADVWTHPALFKLDETKKRKFVAGVPPDGFSDTGQLWGSPVYDWPEHAKTAYAWWISRLRRNFEMFDWVRIDHFRGFAAYWEVPAGDETAAAGEWVDGPGDDFFRAIHRYWPSPPVIAEDLGVITPDVRELARTYALPGMKVLLFAFDGDTATNPYAPHNHVSDSVLYTGTHDNNTVRGWFETEAGEEHKRRLCDYLGRMPSSSEIHREMIRLAMMSVCALAIIPAQDILGLGEWARMNRPAVAEGNWVWRMKPDAATDDIADELARLAAIYGRA